MGGRRSESKRVGISRKQEVRLPVNLTQLFYISIPVIFLLAVWTGIMLLPFQRFRSRSEQMITLLTEIRDRLPQRTRNPDRM